VFSRKLCDPLRGQAAQSRSHLECGSFAPVLLLPPAIAGQVFIASLAATGEKIAPNVWSRHGASGPEGGEGIIARGAMIPVVGSNTEG
jgi:hypothetical protein